MIEPIRNEAKKVNFNSLNMKAPMLNKKEKILTIKEEEIREKFEELKNVEETINSIQSEIENKTRNINQKEKSLVEKERQIVKMAELWKNLNEINLSSLNDEEVKKIVNSQKGFIRDLLEHYTDSSRKEKEYLGKIEKLSRRNDALEKELDEVMEELDKLQ